MSLTRLHLFTSLLAGLLLAASASQATHPPVPDVWTMKGTVLGPLGPDWASEINIGADIYIQIKIDLLAHDLEEFGQFPPIVTTNTARYEIDFLVAIDATIAGVKKTHISTAALPIPLPPELNFWNDIGAPNPLPHHDRVFGQGAVEFPSLVAIDLGLIQFGLLETCCATTEPTALLSSETPLPSPPPPAASFTTGAGLGIANFPSGSNLFADITDFGLTGSTEFLPMLPTIRTVNMDGTITWFFENGLTLCISGCWVDPPISTSFSYEVVGAGIFMSIQDFPTGFAQDFEVSVGATFLGTFGPGDSIDFTTFPGGGVSSFEVAGINPGVDAEQPTAFPLKLVVDSTATQFTMTSVPEPQTTFMLAIGAFALACMAGRRG